MAERAHPDLKGFQDRFFGLIKSKYKKNLLKRYLFCNKYIKNKIVLDIPCGMGWGTSLLKGYKACYGVDIDKNSIIEANKKYKKQNLKFMQGDMTSIDFKSNFFDVVICLEGIEHITYREGQKFLLEARKILKKNGLLIASSPLLREKKYHSGNIYHLYEYKENEIHEIIEKKGFKIINKKYLDTPEKTQILIIVAEK
jgi:ubiquinone/menaquinone biosynthesis C-methylase UbiE